uniref:C2H2-type domain-containing protein n=1 Tax=Anopheles epiroticus TaxID=199890 RepID=A0A182PWI5_9DIPT
SPYSVQPSGASASPSSKFRCDQCNISFGSKSAHTSHMKSHAKQQQQRQGSGCKQEQDTAANSGTEGSGPSSALESVGSGSGSNSNSSFDFSSSQTEGAEQGPSSDEPSSSGTAGHFAIRKQSPASPSTVRSPVQQVVAEEEEDEEDEDEAEESDRKEITPYDGGMTHSYDQSLQRGYGGGVAPALLAAASIAAAVENGCGDVKFCPEIKQQRSISPEHQSALSITRITPPPSSGSSSSSSSSSSTSSSSSSILSLPSTTGACSTLLEPTGAGMASSSGQYVYEPLAIMKHHGYFAPASQITEFRSSSDIVRQVEAAIAGTENLLTPPRSSPESPDRSSSPESDSVLMANRDNNTLPPRKRKLYFKDSQQQQSTGPKLASLEVASHHYGVAQQPMALQHQQQPLPLDAHSGQQQHFHPQHHHLQQPQQQPHYHQLQRLEEEQRSMKLEVLQNVAQCHREQRQPAASSSPPSPPQQQQQQQQQHPCAPQPAAGTSVIRMSSVIQYANKSS